MISSSELEKPCESPLLSLSSVKDSELSSLETLSSLDSIPELEISLDDSLAEDGEEDDSGLAKDDSLLEEEDGCEEEASSFVDEEEELGLPPQPRRKAERNSVVQNRFFILLNPR